MEDKDKELENVPGGQAEEETPVEETPVEEREIDSAEPSGIVEEEHPESEWNEMPPLPEDAENGPQTEPVDEGEALAVMSPVSAGQDEPITQVQDNRNGGGGNKLWMFVSLALVVVLIVVLIKPPFAANKAEAVATVNGEEITKDQLYENMDPSMKQSALDQMISDKLVEQEAVKQNIEITESDVDQEIAMYEKSFGSIEKLEEALKSSSMTMEALREDIHRELLLTKLLGSQITVTDDDVKQIFDDNKSAFDTPEQVRTSIITVATEEEANDVIKQLNEGKDFAELAKSTSLDEYTKANGGDTDFFAKGEQEEAIEEAAFKLAKDEVSGAVKTSGGYTVIKLTDRKEAHTATLEEEKDYIRRSLEAQQVSQLSGTYVEDLRSKATIKNTLTDTADDTENTEDTAVTE